MEAVDIFIACGVIILSLSLIGGLVFVLLDAICPSLFTTEVDVFQFVAQEKGQNRIRYYVNKCDNCIYTYNTKTKTYEPLLTISGEVYDYQTFLETFIGGTENG